VTGNPTWLRQCPKHSQEDHLRKSRKAVTSAEKASETRKAKSYKTMADNQDWLDNERLKASNRKTEKDE
jgi:hypothetical protein